LHRRISKCAQDKQSSEPGAFSLLDALFGVLVDNKEEFVYLFMKKVDLKTFLDRFQLARLYKEVCYCVHVQGGTVNAQRNSLGDIPETRWPKTAEFGTLVGASLVNISVEI